MAFAFQPEQARQFGRELIAMAKRADQQDASQN